MLKIVNRVSLADSNQRKGADDKFIDAIFDQTDFGEQWKV